MAKTNPNEPCFRKSRGTWAIWHDNRQITLGKDKATAFGIWGLLKSGLDIETARAKWTLLQAGDTESKKEDRGPTLESLVAVYLDRCQVNRSEGTYSLCRRYLTSLASFKNYGLLRVSELKARHVAKWVTAKYGDNADTTVRHIIGTIVTALNWCAKPEQGYIEINPIRGMERPEADHREVYISDTEWKKIEQELDKLSLDVRDMILFIWNTGCRPQEARWAECHHFNKHIPAIVFEVKRSKGKKRRRVIPLNPEALAIVQRLVLKHSDGPIFRKDGEAWTRHKLYDAFRVIHSRTGIKIAPYDIRHTFATNSIKRGVDLISLSEIMGHTDLTMLKKNYYHLLMAGDHIQRAVRQATNVV